MKSKSSERIKWHMTVRGCISPGEYIQAVYTNLRNAHLDLKITQLNFVAESKTVTTLLGGGTHIPRGIYIAYIYRPEKCLLLYKFHLQNQTNHPQLAHRGARIWERPKYVKYGRYWI